MRQRKKLDKKLRKDQSVAVELFKTHAEEVMALDEAVRKEMSESAKNGISRDSDQAIAKSLESRLDGLTKNDVFSSPSGNRFYKWYADVQNMTLTDLRVGSGEHRDAGISNTKTSAKATKAFSEKLKDFGKWLITDYEDDDSPDWLYELIFGRKT